MNVPAFFRLSAVSRFDYGRPAAIDLAVLVDRGGRELPIEARWTGARAAVARDVSIVLSRDKDGRLALSTEPETRNA